MVYLEEEESLYKEENNLTRTSDLLSYFGIGLIIIGLIFITLSYAVPREYVFDINRAAREMEMIENEYSNRRFMLDIFATIGATCVGLSGFMVSVILIKHIYTRMQEEDNIDAENVYSDTNPLTYGAIKH